MGQLYFSVSEVVETQLRSRAKSLGLSLSRYLAQLVQKEALGEQRWPEGYQERILGGWNGAPLEREDSTTYENRESLLQKDS